MKERPTLLTDRLILRPFTLDDAPEVQRLAGDIEVARFTLNIPHPYEDGVAEAWISTHQENFERGKLVDFAVVLRESGTLCGAVGMGIDAQNSRASLGYWIGVPFWGQGYATEAARAVVGYGFGELGLHRVFALHMKGNPASGRVMQKIGMSYEGCQRQHVLKWGQFHDLEYYGVLAGDSRAG